MVDHSDFEIFLNNSVLYTLINIKNWVEQQYYEIDTVTWWRDEIFWTKKVLESFFREFLSQRISMAFYFLGVRQVLIFLTSMLALHRYPSVPKIFWLADARYSSVKKIFSGQCWYPSDPLIELNIIFGRNIES